MTLLKFLSLFRIFASRITFPETAVEDGSADDEDLLACASTAAMLAVTIHAAFLAPPLIFASPVNNKWFQNTDLVVNWSCYKISFVAMPRDSHRKGFKGTGLNWFELKPVPSPKPVPGTGSEPVPGTPETSL
nr:hypothetical protein Iba_chr11eCG0800 [Ipomoea batatas]